jgi:hypothetical protein
LFFNCDRALAHVAADAARRSCLNENGRTNGPSVTFDTGSQRTDACSSRGAPDPLYARLAELVRATVVGEPVELHLALAADAVGWSPSGAFTYRDQAVALSLECASSLVVEEFRIESLSWQDPLVSAEWRLVARQSEPLLIDEDILVEPTDRAIRLVGATIATVRRDRVEVLNTYFDDATLIEQILLVPRSPATH